MTTVDDAIEVGARALAELGPDETWDLGHMFGGDDEYHDEMSDQARNAARAMWPVLSAPLRELVTQWRSDVALLSKEADLSYANCTAMDARALEELILQIDKELGND